MSFLEEPRGVTPEWISGVERKIVQEVQNALIRFRVGALQPCWEEKFKQIVTKIFNHE